MFDRQTLITVCTFWSICVTAEFLVQNIQNMAFLWVSASLVFSFRGAFRLTPPGLCHWTPREAPLLSGSTCNSLQWKMCNYYVYYLLPVKLCNVRSMVVQLRRMRWQWNTRRHARLMHIAIAMQNWINKTTPPYVIPLVPNF